MRAGHRLVSLDSTDRLFPSSASTLPGSSFSSETGMLTPVWLFSNPGLQRFTEMGHLRSNQVFAAVPFLGVAYSFGNNGFQGVRVNYHQVLSKNNYISFDYRQFKSDGFLRNNQTIDQCLSFGITHVGRTYSNQFQLSLASTDSYASGGVLNDSSLYLYPIEFVATPKTDARTVVKRLLLDQTNYFNFLNDSVRGMGLFLDNQLALRKFEFTESGALATQYNLIQWDSSATFDRYQSNRLTSSTGMYFSKQSYTLKLGAFGSFWNYYNRGIYRDTLETGLQQSFLFSKGGWSVVEGLRYALGGAQNGLRAHVGARYRFGKIEWSGSAKYSNELPDLNQRFQWGNNYASLASSWNKEKRLLARAVLGYDWNNSVNTKLVANYVSLQNAYFFVQQKWSSSFFPKVNSYSFGVDQSFRFRIVQIEAMYRTTILDGMTALTPSNYAKLRLALKGKPGKRDKLIGLFGVEGEWYDNFQRFSYVPMVGAVDPLTTTALLPGRANAAIFATAEIGLFRIYVRFENLGYFWTDQRWMEALGYPIATSQFKLGITWDFFN